jgi:hypothetical protein
MSHNVLTDSENYARCLLPKGHGYPLWVPKPPDNLPQEYRDRGVDVGDVGIVTSNGIFDFLFSICLPSDHPINCGRTPPGFTHVDLDRSRVLVIDEGKFSSGAYVPSLSVEKKCAQGDFALLENP